MNPLMGFKKLVNRFNLMPTGSTDIEPYGILSESLVDVMKNCHETFPITSIYADKTFAHLKRSRSARKIMPFMMLACGRNTIAYSLFIASILIILK